MNDDRIEQLIRQADASADTPRATDDLAGRVERRYRRRLRVRRTATLCVAVGLVAVGIGVWRMAGDGDDRLQKHGSAARTDDATLTPALSLEGRGGEEAERIAEVEAELAELRSKIAMHEAVIERLLADEKYRQDLAEARAILAQPDPIEQLDRELDHTAYIIVLDANRKLELYDLRDSAADDYRSVIEQYPDSHWADVARQNLNDMNRS